MPDREKMPYRECAGVVLFNREGKVFVGQRAGGEDLEFTWQFPQGGIDTGEDPIDAAIRELYEETSVSSVSILTAAPNWVKYDLPDDLLGRALKGKYRGQQQKWFAMLFEGEDSEIDVLHPGGGAHPAEFCQWRWVALEDTPAMIVPFKREAYDRIVSYFEDIPEKIRTELAAL